MSTNIGSRAQMANHRRADRLAPIQSDRERYVARRLRIACHAQVAHLPKYPASRTWAELGRRDARGSLHHLALGIAHSREAARAALATNDPRVIAETKARIKAYYLAALTEALTDFPIERPAGSTDEVLTVAHKEGAEALMAAMAAKGTSEPTVWERFRKELREAIDAFRVAEEYQPHHERHLTLVP